MPLFQALGLGVLILVLQSSLPNVLRQAEATTIAMLKGAEVSAIAATTIAVSATSTTNGNRLRLPRALPDFPLPQAEQVPGF